MEAKQLLVEYLIITKQEDSFCNSADSFLKFLAVDSSLEISEKNQSISIVLKKGERFTVSYSLESNLVPNKKERYFKLSLVSNEYAKLKEFDQLTAIIEKLVQKIHVEVSINILWNDIARQYSIEGYSIINEVENLLRRLVTNFMLVNVGYDWHTRHIPDEVKNRDSQIKNTYSDYLHQTYFSDLIKIFFAGQRELELRDMAKVELLVQRHISEKKDQIQLDDIRGVIAISLWEKYFAKNADYEKNNLEEDLEKLNNLRNEIAHNRHTARKTLGEIQGLAKKIIKALKLGIEDLPNKVLSAEEQKFLVETENNRIGDYLIDRAEMNQVKAIQNWYSIKYRTNVFKIDLREIFNLEVVTREGRIGVYIRKATTFEAQHITAIVSTDPNILTYVINGISKKFTERHIVIILDPPNTESEYEYLRNMHNLEIIKHITFGYLVGESFIEI